MVLLKKMVLFVLVLVLCLLPVVCAPGEGVGKRVDKEDKNITVGENAQVQYINFYSAGDEPGTSHSIFWLLLFGVVFFLLGTRNKEVKDE